jgi:regulatory protein
VSWLRRRALRAAEDAATASSDADDEPPLDDIRRVLDELEQRGFLSDQRAAEALVHAKAPRYGQRRLRQMLQARSIDADLVSATLEKAGPTELDRAREIWRRRFGAVPATLQERARQQRFLAGRGFDGSVIEKVLREAGRATPEAAADEVD